MNQVDINYKWFEENKQELLKKYKNKFLVIKEKKVIRTTSTMEDAIEYSKNLELGTFIIQKVEKKETAQVFHTRVRFNEQI